MATLEQREQILELFAMKAREVFPKHGWKFGLARDVGYNNPHMIGRFFPGKNGKRTHVPVMSTFVDWAAHWNAAHPFHRVEIPPCP